MHRPISIRVVARASLAIVVAATIALGAATNPAVTLKINAGSNRHPISPLIYGVAFATQAQLADLNAPLNRQGGNATSRYNWQANAYNRAADWYFESIGEASATAGVTPKKAR